MTAWSFIFGVFPLVVATGAGSASRRAIGITTFSGMVMATLIGILFTPALYAIFHEIHQITRETRDIVETEYREGAALVTRLNEAEESVIDAQHSLLAAVINASNAKAQLEAAVYAFSDRKSEE